MTGESQTQAQSAKPEDVVTIKKYSNRRLYDTSQSVYVTLDDLCQMVKDGQDFIVIDAKSGDELTRSVLTQIIFEQESKGYGLLPVSFLRQIISFYDHNLSNMLPPYLEETMRNFTENQEKVQSYMNQLGTFSPFQGFEEIGRQNMEMFEKTMSMFNPFGTNPSDDKKED